jgi:hypothetical protein
MDIIEKIISKLFNDLAPSVLNEILVSAVLLLIATILAKFGVWRKIRGLLIRLRIVDKLDEIHKVHYQQDRWYLTHFLEIVEKNRWDPNKYVRPDFKVKPWKRTTISPRLVLLDGRDIQKDSPQKAKVSKISGRTVSSLLNTVQDLKKVVVLGDPGSGKTVCLLQAGIDLATRGMLSGSVSPKIPIYIPLSEYTTQQNDCAPEDIGKFIVMQLRSQLSGSMSEEFISRFDALRRDGRFLFIFDAMDEMPRSDYYPRFYRIWEFVQRNNNNLFLFSCRFLDYIDDPAFAFSQAILSPFSETQIAEMLKRYLGKEYKHFKTREFIADQEIGVQSRNPFFVSLIAACKRGGVEPGSSWDTLIHNYVDVTLDETRDYFNISASDSDWRALRRDTLKWLSDLAFELTKQRATGTKAEGSLVDRTLISYDNGTKLMDVAQRAGIIKPLADPGSIKFYHHKLQEFFAAMHLVSLDKESQINISELTDDIWWQEVMIMSAGLVPDPDDLIIGLLPDLESPERFAYNIGKDFNRVVLAVKCYFAAKKRVHLETARLLKGYLRRYLSGGNILQRVRILRLVSQFGDRELLDEARRCLEDPSSWVRETALLAIAETIIYVPGSARFVWRDILQPGFAEVVFRMKMRDIPTIWRNPSIRRFTPLLVLLIAYKSVISIGVYLCALCVFALLWYFGIWGIPFFAVLFAVLTPAYYQIVGKNWAMPIARGVMDKFAPGMEPSMNFNFATIGILITVILPLWVLSIGVHFLAEYLGGILLVLASFGLLLLDIILLVILFPLFQRWSLYILELRGSRIIMPRDKFAEQFIKAEDEFKSYKHLRFVDPTGMVLQEREQTALNMLDEIESCPFPDLRMNGIETLLDFLPLGECVLTRLAKLNENEPNVDVRTKGWQIYEQIELSLRRTSKEE